MSTQLEPTPRYMSGVADTPFERRGPEDSTFPHEWSPPGLEPEPGEMSDEDVPDEGVTDEGVTEDEESEDEDGEEEGYEEGEGEGEAEEEEGAEGEGEGEGDAEEEATSEEGSAPSEGAAEEGGGGAGDELAGAQLAQVGGGDAGNTALAMKASTSSTVIKVVRPARIGGTHPPRIDEPPPLPERARKEVLRRTGLAVTEHHDRVRMDMDRIGRLAHECQVDIIHEIDWAARDLSRWIRREADGIPRFVARLVGRIEQKVNRTKREVQDAWGMLRRETETLVDVTHAGLDTALELNRDNVLTLLGQASQEASDLYTNTLAGEYRTLAGQYGQAVKDVPKNLKDSVPTVAGQAEAQWLLAAGPEGEPQTTAFRNEQKGLEVKPLSEDLLVELQQEADARAEVVEGPQAEASFAMGVLAMVDRSAIVFPEETTAAEEVCSAETEATGPRLATPRERALGRIDQARDDAIEGLDRLLSDARSSLTKAGLDARNSFRKQAVEAERSLRVLAPDMAASWATYTRQLDPMAPRGQFLDWHRLGPHLRAHEGRAKPLLAGQKKVIDDQVGNTREGVSDAIEDLKKSLQESTADILRGVDDTRTQAFRSFRLAREALAPFRAFTEGTEPVTETWATATDEKLNQEALDNIATQAREQLAGKGDSIEKNFFKKQLADFEDAAGKKRDRLKPGPDAHERYHGIDGEVERLLAARVEAIHDAGEETTAIFFSSTDEDKMVTALAGFTATGMKALEEEWSVRRGWGDLKTYVRDELDDDDDELAVANMLFAGDTAGAIDAITKTDFTAATTEALLLTLTADDIAAVERRGGWGATADRMQANLHGTNEEVANALMAGDRDKAAALRLEVDANTARSGNDVKATLDVAANVDSSVQRYMSASPIVHASRAERDEFTRTALIEHANLYGNVCVSPDMTIQEARSTFATHLTRTFETTHTDYDENGYSSTYTVTHALSDRDRERVTAVVNDPTGPLASAIRSANVIEHIDGTANDRELVELVDTVEDPAVLRAQHDLADARATGDPDRIRAAESALEKAQSDHARYLYLLADQLGADSDVLADPTRIQEFVTARLRGKVGNREGWGDEFASSIVRDGRVDLLAATMVGTQDSGTNEDLLYAAYDGRTWEEIDALRVDFRERGPGGDLDSYLGVFNGAGFGTELSGDDRQRLERIMVLDAGSDRGLAAAANLDFTHAHQNGVAGEWMMSGGAEDRALADNQDQLRTLIAEAAVANGGGNWAFDEHGRPNPAAFGPDRRFLGDRDRLQALTIRSESRRKQYNAAIDRTVNMITGIIQALATLITAIVLIVACFIPGVNVAAAFAIAALAAGALTIGAKMMFKGQRYGWEEMMVDVGTTAIDTALAFAGGRGAAAMMRQGHQIGKTAMIAAIKRGAIMGAAGGAGHAALQEKTWEDGLLSGFGNLLVEGGIGAATGAATEFLSMGIGNKLGPAGSTGWRGALSRTLGKGGHNIAADAIGDTLGQFMGSLLGTSLHAATGSYQGSLGDAVGEAAIGALAEGLASPIRARAMRRFNAHYGLRTHLADAPNPPDPTQLHALYQTFRRRGDHDGQTFEQFKASFDSLRSTTQARRATAIGDLPDGIRVQFDRVPVETLEALAALARGSGDVEALRESLIQRLWDDADGRMTRSELEAMADERVGAWHAAQEQAVQLRRTLLDQVPEAQREALGALSTASLARALDLAGTEGWTPHERMALLREARARRPSTTAGELFHALDDLGTTVRAQRDAGARAERGKRGALLSVVPPALRGPLSRLGTEALELAHDLISRGSFGTAEERAALARLAPRDALGRPMDVLRFVDAAVRQRQPLVATGPVRAAILASIPPHLRAAYADVEIEILPPALFRERTKSRRGQAAVLVENGRPKVIVRADAELGVLREEGIHLLQATEPGWRAKIAQLDEARLRAWDSLSIEEQAALYRVKLEVEIDGQQRLIAELRAENTPDAHARLADAEATLDALTRRMGEVDALGPRLAGIARGEASRPQYLDQPPRLFAKGSRKSRIAGNVAAARQANARADAEATTNLRTADTESAGSVTHGGKTYDSVVAVKQVFGNLTLGAGFAGVANVVTRGFTAGKDMMIGGPNPWDLTDPSIRLGQTTQGGVGLPNPRSTFAEVVANPGAAHYTMAREHGDHVAVNRAAMGVGVASAHVIRVEPRSTSTEAWPAWARTAKVRVLVGDTESGPYRWVYAESVDLAMGPGPGRRPSYRATTEATLPADLRARLAAENNKAVLRMSDAEIAAHFASGRLATADQDTTIARLDDGEVVIIGGGASGAWMATMAALSRRANPHLPKVEWVAVARDVDAMRAVGGARGAELVQSWHELMTTGGVADARRARDLQKWTFEEAPQNGALKRNLDAEANGIYHPSMRGEVDWKVHANILSIESEGGRFKLTYENGVVVMKDQVVFAIGQDPTLPGASQHVLDPRLKGMFEVIRDGDDRVAGLSTADGAVRVLGMAGVVRDMVTFALPRGDADATLAELRDYASTFHIDSRGVVGGFLHSSRMIGGANQPHLDTLRAALPDGLKGKVDVVPGNLPPGIHARVQYDGNRVWIEVAPHTTPKDITQHLATVRTLRKYTGLIGRVRRVVDRITSFALNRPRYGTKGFEARLELEKLSAIERELHAEIRAARAAGEDTTALDGRRSEIASRIAEFEDAVDSLERGQGWVAAGSGVAHQEALSRGLIAPKDHYYRKSKLGELHLVPMEGASPTFEIRRVRMGNAWVEWPVRTGAGEPPSTADLYMDHVFARSKTRSAGWAEMDTYLDVIRKGADPSATHGQREAARLAEAGLRLSGDSEALGDFATFDALVKQALGLERLRRILKTTPAKTPGELSAAISKVAAIGDTEVAYPTGWRDRDDSDVLADHAARLDARYQEFLDRLKTKTPGTTKHQKDLDKVHEMDGERAATAHLFAKYPDYEMVLGYSAGTGFDQVWVKKVGGVVVHILVVEAKYGTSQLAMTKKKGRQMSQLWVEETAAQGTSAAHQAVDSAMLKGDVPVSGVVIRLGEDGQINETQLGRYN